MRHSSWPAATTCATLVALRRVLVDDLDAVGGDVEATTATLLVEEQLQTVLHVRLDRHRHDDRRRRRGPADAPQDSLQRIVVRAVPERHFPPVRDCSQQRSTVR